MNTYKVQGAGLGLRREFIDELESQVPDSLNFFEVAPENWMAMGGAYAKQFKRFTDQHAFVCHGLSLSIGSPAPLDESFVIAVKEFLDLHQIKIYSEHLSYCSDEGHLYDLLPIPFTEEAVDHVVKRIKRVQEIIERPLAIENVSYYAAPGQQMTEIDFITQVLQKADCQLLLDVNNIYVNSINHNYDALQYLNALPGERIAYAHIAGHYDEADDLKIDTHGDDVKPDVWKLLEVAYEKFGVFPTLLERDFNIPSLNHLFGEMNQIHRIQKKFLENGNVTAVNVGAQHV
jgi:uncharacterized protein